MRKKTPSLGAMGFALVSALIAAGLFNQAPASAKGKDDVTFVNKGRFIQQLLVSYGADAKCGEMPEKENIDLDPGQSQVVSSGDSRVCWCGVAVKNSAAKKKITRCGEWRTAKPGRKVRIGS